MAELAAGWEAAARANQVYPLDEGSRLRYVVRPPYDEPLKEPVRIVAGTHTLERYRSQLLIQWRSFDVDVELAFAHRRHRACWSPTATRAAATSLYVDDGDELVFVHNGYGAMTEVRGGHGARRRDAASAWPSTAPGGWTWDVDVSVDGEVARPPRRAW